jgi:hypothetical protein
MKHRLRIFTGILNLVLAIFLLIFPLISPVENEGIMFRITLCLAGFFLVFISLISNHELGIFKTIRYKNYLAAGVFFGLFLTLSPFFFDFYDQAYRTHVIVGLFQVLTFYVVYRIHFQRRRNYLPPQVQH